MRTLAVAPSMGTLTRSMGISKATSHQWHRYWTVLTTLIVRLAGLLCATLLVIDVVANNWELIDYIGDGSHFLTPFFDINTIDDLEAKYNFPARSAPSQVSKIGRYMIGKTLWQTSNDDDTYYLSMSSYKILDSSNDICGTLAQTYTMDAAFNSTVNLGMLTDGVTYIRGNTLTHWFGTTKTDPVAPSGSNDTVLRAMNYIPARVTTDLRLTTPIPIPPSGQVSVFNVSMYRFLNTAYCSGCFPQTELGLDTCTIVYSYNNATKQLRITSSKATIGDVHLLGMMFKRNWSPILSLYIRGISVLIAIGGYIASEKTVKWTEPKDLNTWYKRLIHKVAPTLYRHPSNAFEFSYMCFNSDIFVVLYTLAVLVDENISMVFSRTMYRWHQYGNNDIWIDLRIMAMSFRWLWFNCFIVKVCKWFCNFISKATYSGDNFIVGWLNFSSVFSIYLGVIVLFERNDFIEYGNSVRASVTSRVQNLDAIYVEFFDSWYIRAAWPFGLTMVVNLIAVLTIDRMWNRRWWHKLALNSMGRQHMYNSTSILCDCDTAFVPRDGYLGVVVEVKARALCTIQWFFSTHLTCFGLPENPKHVRQLASGKAGQTRAFQAVMPTVEALDGSMNSKHGTRKVSTVSVTKESEHAGTTPFVDDDIKPSEHTNDDKNKDLVMIVQDRDGHLRMFDSDKKEVQALGIEVKILRDSCYQIG